MKSFKEKTVVITGAGSGIGRALAIQFAKEGACLALNDFDAASLEKTIELCSAKKIYSEVFDVSNRQEFECFAQNVAKEFGGVSVVINNAGVALGKKTLEQTKYKDFEWIMNINFWGTVYGTKLFLPYLLREKEASIVNISSVFGLAGISEQIPYCSTKFAVRGFTESLRMELTDKPICVSVVHPGGIQTNIAKNSKGWEGVQNREQLIDIMEKKTFINTASFAAQTIVKGIRKKKSKILIGRDAHFINQLVRLLPVAYSNIIFRQMKKFNVYE